MRIKLSLDQLRVLTVASDGQPIYGEKLDFYQSAPEGRTFFSVGGFATIRSLVKHGFLVNNGKAGYVITPSGREALKNHITR